MLDDGELVLNCRADAWSAFSDQEELVFAFRKISFVNEDVMPSGTERTALELREEHEIGIAKARSVY